MMDVYLFSYNNAEIVPYVMDYWRRINPNKIYVADNESTDGTVELLKQYDNVVVKSYSTGGKYDPYKVLKFKQECWKHSKNTADYVYVGSFDEVLHCYYDLNTYLDYCKKLDITVLGISRFDILSESLPEYNTYNGLIHESECVKLYHSPYHVNVDRPCIFNPAVIRSIDISLNGNITVSSISGKFYDTKLIQQYHLHDIDANMICEKNMHTAERIYAKRNRELLQYKRKLKRNGEINTYIEELRKKIKNARVSTYQFY